MRRIGIVFERVSSFGNLCRAARRTARGKRGRPDAAEFLLDLEPSCLRLEGELRAGAYEPAPYRTFVVRDPKQRLICAAEFRDRVVHHAVCDVLEPLLDRTLIADTFACRKDRGMHAALARCRHFAAAGGWFLKTDIAKYYESVRHGLVFEMLGRKIKDRAVMALLRKILEHQPPGCPPGIGLPIGNLTSQLLANHFLDGLDRTVKQRLRVRRYLRYMDDIVLMSDDAAEVKDALAAIREYVTVERQLRLKESGTFIAPVSRGVPFLGFSIFPHACRMRRPNLRRSVRNLRRRLAQFADGDLDESRFRQSVRSILEHLTHGNTRNLRLKILNDLGAF